MPVESLQAWLINLASWLQFWFIPRFFRSLVILIFAYFFAYWAERIWQRWLYACLISAKERSAAQAVWRRNRLLSLPSNSTRTLVGIVAIWLIAEQFNIPREVIIWVATAILVGFLWCTRYLLADIAAGYAILLDDMLAEGDQISAPFGEGTVERISWFSIHLHTNDGTKLIVPNRAMKSNAIKVRSSLPSMKL